MYSPKNPYYSARTVSSGIHKPVFRKGGQKEVEEKEKKSMLPDIDISKMMKGFGDESKGVSRDKNHIFFYDDVTTDSCLLLNREIQAVVRELRSYSLDYSCESPKIYIHINSYGGELLACFSTLDYIKNCPVPVVSIIEGCAANAATLISVVASERYMTSSSWMLIHQLSGGYWGKYEEMEEDLDNSRKFMEKIYEIYEEHTKLTRSELKKILKRDEWWDYKTCLKYGLVNGVYNGWGGVRRDDCSGGAGDSGGGSSGGAAAAVIAPSGGVLTRSSSKK